MRAETSNSCGTLEASETQQITMATQTTGLPPPPPHLPRRQSTLISQWKNNTYRSLLSVGGRDGSKVNCEKPIQILVQEKQQTAATKLMSRGLERMHQMGANAEHGVHCKLTMITV